MKKITLMTGMVLVALGTHSYADELDELDIQLVDESNKSEMIQKKIVGCNDHVKKEMTCSKEPTQILLSRLPSSNQLSDSGMDTEEELSIIKEQINEILEELNELRKVKNENKQLKAQLQGLIKTISAKKPKSPAKKLTKVKRRIKNIVKKNSKGEIVSTYISKPIKEIKRTNSYVIIEVQSGESLSTYAQAYYQDNRQYYRIYKANRDKIPENMLVAIGEHLTIPLD
jgi:regulator of replication initiation timing